MLVLLTTSLSVWLPVALARPVPDGPEYTTNNRLLPPVAMDSTGSFVVVWESFGSAGTDTGKSDVGVQAPAVRQRGDGDPNDQAEPAVALDSTGNLVVVWLSDEEPRVGHRSIARLGYSVDTSPGSEGRAGRETTETSAQPPHVGEFTKSHVPSVPVDPYPASGWNGGSLLP